MRVCRSIRKRFSESSIVPFVRKITTISVNARKTPRVVTILVFPLEIAVFRARSKKATRQILVLLPFKKIQVHIIRSD